MAKQSNGASQSRQDVPPCSLPTSRGWYECDNDEPKATRLFAAVTAAVIVMGVAVPELVGADRFNVLNGTNKLSAKHQVALQPRKSIAELEEELAKQMEKLGPDHPDTLTTMNDLSVAYQLAGQLSKSLPLSLETLAKRKLRLGAD